MFYYMYLYYISTYIYVFYSCNSVVSQCLLRGVCFIVNYHLWICFLVLWSTILTHQKHQLVRWVLSYNI